MVTKSQVGALTSVGVVAFAGGVVLGHFLALRSKKGEVITLHTVPARNIALEKTGPETWGIVEEGDDESVVVIETVADAAPVESVVNLLTVPDGDWNYEAELSTRTGDIPYIIHKDEFFGDEMDFKQGNVTYYKGDDILCDELEKPIFNYGHFIGHNLAFGHGSGDPNVFYVRNEHERMEWEVVLDEGRYEVEVLGLEVEHGYEEQDLKHSVRRFVMD